MRYFKTTVSWKTSDGSDSNRYKLALDGMFLNEQKIETALKDKISDEIAALVKMFKVIFLTWEELSEDEYLSLNVEHDWTKPGPAKQTQNGSPH